ncbi:MAG TPA: hypothetical protein VGM34_04215 [Chlamydiales bacterium]|jgi:hypothetical protein
MADPISKTSSATSAPLFPASAPPPLVFGADFVEKFLREKEIRMAVEIERSRIEINRVNREQWAKESPISYQIHVITEPFFKAIIPKSVGGLAICIFSGCAGFTATLFSLKLAIPTLLLHLGISRIVTKTEKQEV